MNVPAQGIGLGLRHDLAEELIAARPEGVHWVEVHPENYIQRGGRYESFLERAQEHWPVITHGLSMCFGALEAFDDSYLRDLRDFLKRLDATWHSEHLCFGGGDGRFTHDLLPLPFTKDAADLCVQRIVETRDRLGVDLALENVSYYAKQSDNGLDEASFVLDILERADAKLLLDVNNVYVNSQNFGFDPRAYIDQMPVERIVQLHVAGHFVRDDGICIDTHGESVCEDVYELLEYALNKIGPIPVLLERDNNIPSFDELLVEIERLNAIYDRAVGDSDAA